ncbi:hypothetical protein B0I27_101474 [Arcticibacter pallidicorallinus]|uniref:Uncharacterized protein n=1 Tax=Arcticibacter pallidicorallinus TaxID=1259464 RepID=A0A2T0UC82_9SPHI|nr:hypothetical protein B0I27_101474 [Arcticibacter pallidicorallinus]
MGRFVNETIAFLKLRDFTGYTKIIVLCLTN